MNWQFWKRESVATAAARREIEALRKAHVHTLARVFVLERENAEAWEVLALLWKLHENPDAGFFANLRFLMSPTAEKLKRLAEQKKEAER